MNYINVFTVIPAYNAVTTIAETLKSLQSQTYTNWEAIVVNDGSTDETEAIALQFASEDSRIRVISQPNQGVCAARNTGIGLANCDWLLFLDADDWLAPQYMEKMTNAIAADSTLDVVHCGWSRVAPNGTLVADKFGSDSTDLFPILSQQCPFAVHACIVRKQLVDAVGGFDTSLITCEEWDLWQRIARTGARFGAVKEVMAFYRMRPGSLSRDGNQFFADAMRVLTQGYYPDPRVPKPLPQYAQGQPQETLPRARLHLSSWLAGLFLGQGEDARHLLKLLGDDCDPGLNPYWVADNIFESALLLNCQLPSAWIAIWPGIAETIKNFLLALEERSQAAGLARRTSNILERMVLQHAQITEPITIGITHAVNLELTELIENISLPESVERLYCVVQMAGCELGRLELPVCDGLVTSWVIKDAIASQFAWSILGRFFQQTIYSPSEQNSHDQIGWTTFLQQLWGLPDWTGDRFYDADFAAVAAARTQAKSGSLVVEISEELTDIEVTLPELEVIFTVGGVALGVITIPVKNNLVTAQTLRVALTTFGGFELCCACVREGLIGQSLNNPTPLRCRLAEAARSKSQLPQWFAAPGFGALIENQLVSDKTLVLSCRQDFHGSPQRRAIMPKANALELLQMAQVTGEGVIQMPISGQIPERIIYAPEALSFSSGHPIISTIVPTTDIQTNYQYGREHFETLFSKQPDPWKYTSPYEQTKYEQTLSLLPSKRISRALELACAEGHFTVQLAPCVDSLIAADISQIAIERTAQRCSHLKNISYQQLDLTKDVLPQNLELIVCSEVLYYIGGLEQLKAVADKFVDALQPGGYLLMAHAHQIIDEPDKPGFDWGLSFGAKAISDTFNSIASLRLVKEIRTPFYRVQLFQRQPRFNFLWYRQNPKIVTLTQQPTALPTEVESSARWNGVKASENIEVRSVTTKRLPILMYHRIAPTGSKKMEGYRVTPEAFEQQLRYLRDAGFYSVAWEQWHWAMATRQPLPGQAIAITFDDGYLDFYEYAWPLLKKYGFTATVFLVAEYVGNYNIWDKAYEEELPLLGWREIRQLQDEGVVFGSHSATHKPLTSLSPTEIVDEAARSRILLTRGLRMPVNLFAYPYGDSDPVVEHLIGACGYKFGLSCRSGLSQLIDKPLALPRIEVMGSDSLQEFVAKLSA
ncbi:glycosyltransferase [Tolypothrix sp. PCC 7910]|uniref:trifunctional glycosyltransferase/class I SAM-dependent methyltransferase/polysaccharide deacetylase n=1 Tax=Tolypothrix sp. PCC 7910 TaxID=2099387 RepID=UPI0014277EDA|nr:trifunctional glycosyltransferase/class I SAM-dependent methyltransferase/polysaccharide deacetylase [Tolypothrix sp. PCC 7910]QIR40005.1 glycosyltransferase [Tolypothrix sp. PCC 7910]